MEAEAPFALAATVRRIGRVAPLVWPTSGAAPATAAAAAGISESGTQRTIASQPLGTSPRPAGPSVG